MNEHAIKGAVQMTGASRLAACRQRLEDAIRSRGLEEAGLLSASVHEAFEVVAAAVLR
jgi:HPt (histidine-containing phosphotransfer) domain-containing protein